jgi:predicted aspartyl protease
MPILANAVAGCALLPLCVSVVPATAQSATVGGPMQNAIHSIPMEVVHGKPYVMVMVNGRGPYRFMVDTGTGGEAIVSLELAQELKLPIVDKTRLSDPSKEGQHTTDVVMIDSLDIAGVEFTEVMAARHRIYGEEDSCQGILGFPMFENYLLTLDFPDQRLTLSSGALVPDGESSVLPFRMPDGVPIAPMRIGALRVEAQFDSGGTGLSLPERLIPRLKLSADPVPFGLAESLSSRFEIKLAKLISDVRLGQYTFSESFVEVNPAFPLVNFGAYAMGDFAITFDQMNQLLRLDASQKTLHLPPTPAFLHLQNTPTEKPPAQALVPVG